MCTTVSSGSSSSRATDRVHDDIGVAEGAARRTRATLEQGVAGEHAAEVVDVEAHRARRVARGVDHLDRSTPDRERLVVGEVDVPELGALLVAPVGQLPQRAVVGVQQDRRPGAASELRRHAHVVVVGVGAHDRLDGPAGDDRQDRVDVVGGVDDQALLVVTDHPQVVVDVVRLAVQGERPRDDGVVDPHGRGAHQQHHHRTQHGLPSGAWCILSKAASTSPMPISSVTNASRSSRPCW